MEWFDGIMKAVASNPSVALLVLSLIALGWLFRDARARDQAHEAKIVDLYEAHAKAMQDAQAAHLQTAMQVAPLASKLVTCVEVLERLSNAALSRGGGV